MTSFIMNSFYSLSAIRIKAAAKTAAGAISNLKLANKIHFDLLVVSYNISKDQVCVANCNFVF